MHACCSMLGGGQRTVCGNKSSPSMWALVMGLMLASKYFYLLNHLANRNSLKLGVLASML